MKLIDAQKINPTAVRRDCWPEGESIESLCGGLWDKTVPSLMVTTYYLTDEDKVADDWKPVIGWLAGHYAFTEWSTKDEIDGVQR